ncbi:O-antigen ligase family protein [Phosphitispora sp. TUW77]|uniref:O-antigen ligase family protein n=1 Tax=Phosphitispora sp. TUW77 TaxID=3152361 RepID=UPI003AB1664B
MFRLLANCRQPLHNYDLEVIMGVSGILLALILLTAPSVRGLYYEQEMFVFQVIVFAVFIIFLTEKKAFKLNRPLDYAVFTFLGVYMISLLNAADFREALLAVMRIISYTLIYIMISVHTRNNDSRYKFLRVIYLSGSLMILVTLFNLTGIGFDKFLDGSVITTAFEYKNTGALFLLLCSLIGIYLAYYNESRKNDLLIGVGNYLNFLIIIGTQSRTVWLLLSISCILLLAGLPSQKRGRSVLGILISLLPAVIISEPLISLVLQESFWQTWLLVIAGGLAVYGGILMRRKLEERIITRGFMGVLAGGFVIALAGLVLFGNSSTIAMKIMSISFYHQNVQERLVFFKDALKIIAENPVLGAGGKAWDILYLNIQSFGYYAENVHNDFLQVAVEAGIIGLAAFVFIWVCFYITGLKIYCNKQAEEKTFSWLILVLGFTTMLHILFDFDLPHSAMAFLLWSLFGMARALEDVSANATGAEYRSRFLVLILVAGFLYITSSLSFLTGDVFFARGEKALARGDLYGTREYFFEALKFDPFKTNTLVSLAQINLALAEQGDYTALNQAIYFGRKAIAARPNEPLSHAVYATALFYKGEYEESVAETQKYVSLHPMLTAAYEELVKRNLDIIIELKKSGEEEKALMYLDFINKIPGMIERRIGMLSQNELNLWRGNNSEPVLSVTPVIKKYIDTANLLVGDSQTSEMD